MNLGSTTAIVCASLGPFEGVAFRYRPSECSSGSATFDLHEANTGYSKAPCHWSPHGVFATQYIHAPPTPDLNPKPGDGVTGLDTFVGLPIPADHNARISSGATTLDVYIEVTTVIIRWGDGEIDTYPATNDALAGYPDGFATHTFGTKNHDGVNLAVSYDWTARWRVVGGSWEFLAVPNTTTTVLYPISEIVSVLTG